MFLNSRSKRTLREVLADYLLRHTVCAEHRKSMERTVRRLEEAAGVWRADQLNASSVTKMFESIRGTTSTQAGYRRIALTLWRHAVREGCAQGPVEARPVKVRIPPVRAWTAEELTRLFTAGKRIVGNFRTGCPKSLYWQAFVLTGYETGLRLGDLLALRRCDFEADCATLAIVTQKTNVPVFRALTPQCAAAVRAMFAISPDGSLFAWALSRRYVKSQFSRLARSVRLDGSVRWLRRTGATACEAESPGSATRFLAHRSPGVAARHYVDWSKVTKQPAPPPLPLERETG